MELGYDFRGEDNNLDMVAALLTMGMTPNVCFHKEKRKVSLATIIVPALLVTLVELRPKIQLSPSYISGFNYGIESSIDSQVICHLQ